MGKINKEQLEKSEAMGQQSLMSIARFVEIIVLLGTMMVLIWQTNIMSRESKYKTRPLLAVSKTPMAVDPEGKITIDIYVQNYGIVPAKNFSLKHRLVSGGMVMEPDEKGEYKPKCIMPGQEFKVLHANMEGQRVHDIWNKKDTLVYEGMFKYFDEDGTPYQFESTWEFKSTGPKTFEFGCTKSDYK